MKRTLLLLWLLTATLTPSMADEKTPLALIQSYNQAIQTSDVDALQKIFAPDYTEVSPLGDVDDRKKVIEIYKEQVGKPSGLEKIELEEPKVRNYGTFAVVIAKESFVLTGGVRRSLRATFVCRLVERRWQLVSTHVTGVRPK